jgi:hypothetical protein
MSTQHHKSARRWWVGMAVWLLLGRLAHGADTLYNGIELPTPWPPRLSALPDALPQPAYLQHPPAVIPIDVGRQLFVDDFLIEGTTMTRHFHTPVAYPGNPILQPDQPWERRNGTPMAMPFSGGVWVDPADGLFKMWYMAGYAESTALALSNDGLTWRKPNLGNGTNVVFPGTADAVVIDPLDPDPARRYKLFAWTGGANGPIAYTDSADGITWRDLQWQSGIAGDRSTVFFNPFRNKWVFSIRESTPNGERGRIRRYWETEQLTEKDVHWGAVTNPALWMGADRGVDLPRADLGIQPQLYNLDCFPYESLMVGMFSIFRGRPAVNNGEGRLISPGRPKCNDVCVGFSRDGFSWSRSEHTPFFGVSERRGAWNWGNVQSTAPGCLVVGDTLYFYFSGRAGEAGSTSNDAAGSTGVAFLRRDGFASMEAGDEEATLTTRPVRFQGAHLFVNVDAPAGELRVEVLDEQGQTIAPFSKARCHPVRANSTLQRIGWAGGGALRALIGRPVRFRFYLTRGSLYAFWVAAQEHGGSGGYLAGGGPGYTGFQDTLGLAAYPRNATPWARIAGMVPVRDTDGDGSESVALDGSASQDPYGTIVRYEWFEEQQLLATGREAGCHLPVGEHTLTLVVTDDHGARGYAKSQVVVLPAIDSAPPRTRLVLWLKADSIPDHQAGAAVAHWPDASGNRLHINQSVADKCPRLTLSACNGLPAVHFDGVNDVLQTAYYRGLLFTYHQVSLFAVFRPEGPFRSHGLISQGQNGFFVDNDAVGGSLVYHGPNWTPVRAQNAGGIHPGAWYLGAFVRTGSARGEAQLFLNGARVDDGSAAIAYHNVNAEFGLIGALANGAYLWHGDIAEILVYGDGLAASDRQAVERYLSRKYRIPCDAPY